ncbi:MAG TPA: prepilin-type N-terminal cleavage/methylation domain-containing protein [Pirellulales bacterium]|nr:prepilin-type N-terminal cleavage/methylation domain-containing protein [Pirellulales bacterium]
MRARSHSRASRQGFTLVEVLIAATLSLVLIGLVVQIFATVGATATETRAVVQMTDRLRAARVVLTQDLSNTTVEMLPLKPNRSDGYLEYIEGPDGPIFPGLGASPVPVAYDSNQTDGAGAAVVDSTVGDPDDVLMFTAQAPKGTYFYGRVRAASQVVDGAGRIWTVPVDTTTRSQQAEICYFLRGDTLYRRVLLVLPTAGVNGIIDPTIFLWSQYQQNINASTTSLPHPIWDISFYDKFDLSARQEGGTFDISNAAGGTRSPMLVANGLSDLARRQSRYGHQPWVYPYDVHFWDTRFWTTPATNVPGGFLGLPTLRECTAYTGTSPGGAPPANTTVNNGVARWPFPLFELNPTAGLPLPSYLLQNVSPATPPSTVTVTGNANEASGYLWGTPISYGASGLSAPAWVQPPISPYNMLPLIYPYPTSPPPGTTAANFQAVSTYPTGPAATWTGRMNITANNGGLFDLWSNPYPLDQQDPVTGSVYAFSSAFQPASSVNVNFSTRYADDVLLTHVLSFDVKAWDPTAPTIQTDQTFGGIPAGTYMPGDPGYLQIFNAWASGTLSSLQGYLQPAASVTGNASGGYVVAQGAYVDLNYLGPVIGQFLSATPPTMAQALASVSTFAGPGVTQFGTTFSTGSGLGMIYDTGCFDYENDGIDQNQDGIIDNYTNGIDDNGIGGVDDITEVEGPTPYPVPLRGIQIKIRVYDPDSRQIREVTVTQSFTAD